MERMSTGLCNKLLDTDSLAAIFNLCRLRIFDAVAAHADDAESGTLLCELTVDHDGVTGLTFDPTAAAGVLQKATAEAWQGVILADGTARSWRLCAVGDTAASSTTEARLQGTIGLAGTDILVADTNFVTSVVFELVNFYQAFQPK
jgi:hypothetical protein